MIKVTRVLLTATALGLAGGIAMAADLDQPIFIETAPDYQPVEIGTGWYLRGDIGWAASSASGAFHYRTFDPVTRLYQDQSFATGEYDPDYTIGFGAGYQMTDYLRVDGTLDYYQLDFAGTTTATTPCTGQPAGTTCMTVDTQSADAWQVMANAYVDLGTIKGFTPYVGGGIGMTYLDFGSLTNQPYCVAGTAACTTPLNGTPVTHEGVQDWRFTYALAAGVSYNMSKNTKLDIGYRYTKVEGGDTFEFDAASQTAGATGPQGSDKGYERHDIRAGIRYSLW